MQFLLGRFSHARAYGLWGIGAILIPVIRSAEESPLCFMKAIFPNLVELNLSENQLTTLTPMPFQEGVGTHRKSFRLSERYFLQTQLIVELWNINST